MSLLGKRLSISMQHTANSPETSKPTMQPCKSSMTPTNPSRCSLTNLTIPSSLPLLLHPLLLARADYCHSLQPGLCNRHVSRSLPVQSSSPGSRPLLQDLSPPSLATPLSSSANISSNPLPLPKAIFKQEMQGICSTQQSITSPKFQPSADKCVHTNWVYMQPIELTCQICSDQTGWFSITSSQGNIYIMFVNDYGSNAIITQPITSCTKNELLRACTALHTMLTDHGLKPILQRLDNKAPGKLKRLMQKHNVTFQLLFLPISTTIMLPRNPSSPGESSYFISSFSSMYSNFSRHLCCCLIEQATVTLNLLWLSHVNPHLSAEANLIPVAQEPPTMRSQPRYFQASP
jgi:hypothetical protein